MPKREAPKPQVYPDLSECNLVPFDEFLSGRNFSADDTFLDIIERHDMNDLAIEFAKSCMVHNNKPIISWKAFAPIAKYPIDIGRYMWFKEGVRELCEYYELIASNSPKARPAPVMPVEDFITWHDFENDSTYQYFAGHMTEREVEYCKAICKAPRSPRDALEAVSPALADRAASRIIVVFKRSRGVAGLSRYLGMLVEKGRKSSEPWTIDKGIERLKFMAEAEADPSLLIKIMITIQRFELADEPPPDNNKDKSKDPFDMDGLMKEIRGLES